MRVRDGDADSPMLALSLPASWGQSICRHGACSGRSILPALGMGYLGVFWPRTSRHGQGIGALARSLRG